MHPSPSIQSFIDGLRNSAPIASIVNIISPTGCLDLFSIPGDKTRPDILFPAIVLGLFVSVLIDRLLVLKLIFCGAALCFSTMISVMYTKAIDFITIKYGKGSLQFNRMATIIANLFLICVGIYLFGTAIATVCTVFAILTLVYGGYLEEILKPRNAKKLE
jgi:hypothetical protein